MMYEAKVDKGLNYTFHALLIEGETDCLEEVWLEKHGERERVHLADFPTSNLGTASRDEYTRVMCSSIADRWWKRHK